MSETSDQHNTVQAVEYERYRTPALLLEFLPLFVGLFGVLFNVSTLTIMGFSIACFFYIFLSWYFFKALKYRAIDKLIATFFGMGISITLMGILFWAMDWEGKKEMAIIGNSMLLFCLGLSGIYFLIRYFTAENWLYEFTNSIKILSRLIFLFVIYYAFGLNTVLGNVIFGH